jgi:hypothetical protein
VQVQLHLCARQRRREAKCPLRNRFSVHRRRRLQRQNPHFAFLLVLCFLLLQFVAVSVIAVLQALALSCTASRGNLAVRPSRCSRRHKVKHFRLMQVPPPSSPGSWPLRQRILIAAAAAVIISPPPPPPPPPPSPPPPSSSSSSLRPPQDGDSPDAILSRIQQASPQLEHINLPPFFSSSPRSCAPSCNPTRASWLSSSSSTKRCRCKVVGAAGAG